MSEEPKGLHGWTVWAYSYVASLGRKSEGESHGQRETEHREIEEHVN